MVLPRAAHKLGSRVVIYSRNGHDFTERLHPSRSRCTSSQLRWRGCGQRSDGRHGNGTGLEEARGHSFAAARKLDAAAKFDRGQITELVASAANDAWELTLEIGRGEVPDRLRPPRAPQRDRAARIR